MTNRPTLRLWIAAFAMIGATVAAQALKPTRSMARSGDFNLEQRIPKALPGWSAAPDVHLVDPPQEGSLEKQVYNQEVIRGYRNAGGAVVMVLIAYGEDQSERLQLHRPEVCYAAEGYRVTTPSDATLAYQANTPPLAIRRLIAKRDNQVEPITYWMRIGYDVSEGLLTRQRLKLEYGLRQLIPDGALVRTSTVGLSQTESFEAQDALIRALLAGVDPETRIFLAGDPSKAFLRR